MDVRQRIIEQTELLFFKYGVKSVTMDEVARHLSISKKTIYQFFKDKDDLVTSVTHYYLENQESKITKISQESANPIDEVLKISEFTRTLFQNMNSSMLFDIQKFHPNAWKIYEQHKEKCVHQSIVLNLKRGIEEGYYRKEMDLDIIARLRIEQIVTAFDPRIFPPEKFNIAKVQMQFFDHFLHGICTLKGHKLINKYKHITEED